MVIAYSSFKGIVHPKIWSLDFKRQFYTRKVDARKKTNR